MLKKIRNRINRLYFYNQNLSEMDYRRSRLMLILTGPTASMISTLTAGSFFIGYLFYLGAGEQYCAIIGAIPQLGSILMMFSPYLFERLKHRKLLICLSCFLFRFSVSSVIFIPYLISGKVHRLTAIMIIYTFGFLAAGFVTPGLSNWTLSVAPEKNRGRFLALKDIASMSCISVVSIVTGRMLDYYKIMNKSMIGFSIMFGTALLLSILDFILLSYIEEPFLHREPVKLSLWRLIKTPLFDKKYNKMILFLVIWSFAVQFSVSFLPIFMLSELKLNYTFISSVSVAGNVLGMITTYLWGHLADRTSWSHLLKMNGILIALCYLGWTFVTPHNARILVLILQIVMTSSNGAFMMASANLQYNLSPITGKTAYLGVTSAVSYVISFLGAILGSTLYRSLKEVKFNILEHFISNIQVLFLITGIMLTTALLVIHSYIKQLTIE